jgi:hypothetical protein
MPRPNLRVERRPAEELTDAQIEQLMTFGSKEAELIDDLEAATRAGDKDLVWQIAQALCHAEDEAKKLVV